MACRTVRLGGHVLRCTRCDHRELSYNSCRNRHCPKCQGLDAVRWLGRQLESLLPIEYHHVVFTVPRELHPFFRVDPRLAYGVLFQSVAETLREVALRPTNLGARIGFTLVLHTWTQQLALHPHLHCIVTGGGLSLDGTRWTSAKPRFLFALKILKRVFRGKLCHKLEESIDAGEFAFLDREQGRTALVQATKKSWVVYSKPPFAGPGQVLRYLSRYTHRIAISNSRILSLEDGHVTFRWRDRSDNNKSKTMRLPAKEFLRRFIVHVLPPRFTRIRHYGLLANNTRREQIARCRTLLGVEPREATDSETAAEETWQALFERVTGVDITSCPRCKIGKLIDSDGSRSTRVRPRSPPRDRAQHAA